MIRRAESDRLDRRGLVSGDVVQTQEQPLLDPVELETALEALHVRPSDIRLELEVSAALRACSEPESHSKVSLYRELITACACSRT